MKLADRPHAGIAALASGLMALALAGGLQLLGLMARMDAFFSAIFVPEGISPPAAALGTVTLWLAAAALAFGLPAVILNIPAMWRRAVVWAATVVLTLAWGPVLMLCSMRPEIGVAVTTVLWSGACAMFYAASHTLPADLPATQTKPREDGPR